MEDSALVCPSCRRQRIDIYKLTAKSAFFTIAAAVCLTLGLLEGEWQGWFWGDFRIDRFFESLSGWILIGASIAAVHYNLRLFKAVGTVWF